MSEGSVDILPWVQGITIGAAIVTALVVMTTFISTKYLERRRISTFSDTIRQHFDQLNTLTKDLEADFRSVSPSSLDMDELARMDRVIERAKDTEISRREQIDVLRRFMSEGEINSLPRIRKSLEAIISDNDRISAQLQEAVEQASKLTDKIKRNA